MRLLDLVDSHSIDVVDFSFYAPLSPYVTFLRILRPSVRLVYTEHRSTLPEAPRSGWMRSLLKHLAYRQYHTLFGISDFSCEALQRSTGREIARCRLFINTSRFRADSSARTEVRSRLGAGNEFVALVVAHLIVWKGIDVALKAIAAASDSAQLWIVGAGPDLDRLRTLADELGLGPRTLFLGQQLDVSPYLQGADCLVCPSIWGEAMGFVNLEAMACGLPVIASRIGGIVELVADGTTGFLVEPGSVEQTAAALRGLRESPNLCRELGSNGVTFVRENYSQEACLDRYLRNYELVCGIADHRVDCENVGYGRNRHVA
jgi:glycosyltransferase involved in cell wall biosynthesis